MNKTVGCVPSNHHIPSLTKGVALGAAVGLITALALSRFNQSVKNSFFMKREIVYLISGFAGLASGVVVYSVTKPRSTPQSEPSQSIPQETSTSQPPPPVIGYEREQEINLLQPNSPLVNTTIELFGRHFAQEENHKCGERRFTFFGVQTGMNIQEGKIPKARRRYPLSSLQRFGVLFHVATATTSHFVLGTVDMQSKKICIHDPIHRRYKAIENHFKNWVCTKLENEGQTVNPDEWKCHINQGTPRQTPGNGHDCGVIEVMILERFFHRKPICLDDFTQTKVDAYRAKMRLQLLPSPYGYAMTAQEAARVSQ